MNILSFIQLIREIFYKEIPDIKKIQEKGLLAVKIAQTFALRIDFLDEKKCIELSKLFTHVENIPSENIEELIKKYVDSDWNNNFKDFNFKSFASASIGQVHRAKLKNGQDVAVKIIKGDFKEQFKKDVKSVVNLFKLLILFYPKLSKVADPIGTLNSIKKFTLDELDLRNEFKNREVLIKIYEENKDKVNLSKLKLINIIPDISNENIMVSEFIEGSTFDKLLSENKMPYEILLDLFHIHGFYLFGIGIFHGDIHPGNIILNGENICFVDCGSIGEVSKNLRIGLFRFMESLSYYEFSKCAFWLNKMSDIKLEGKKYANFESKFLDLYKDFENSTVSEVSLTKKMMETIKLGVNCGMRFEQGMFPVIKSLMYLDGMVLRCNPNAVLMKDMRRFITELNQFI